MIVEHRKYMRVDDRLVISWRPADSEELVADDLRDVMLMTVNREINDMISGLAKDSPEVAQILLHLNHKLELLSDQSRENIYGPSLVRLNMSRSGIAFEWRGEFKPGSRIRLSITLPPENTKLTIAAEVLACDSTGNQRSRVRCFFVPGQDNKVEALGAYIDYIQAMRHSKSQLHAPLPGEARPAVPHDVRSSATDPAALTDYR